ncbi:ATP synthase (F/14-kDa) subunit [Nautilia profundicola AmH]|uniref:ATP synthase (F/14-kDa) subunit n=1 Tax=Nautilia profundicola (strain ATCC BAA-1463 / DSM 18972 / AmH) TaxID=598659 RepID=B9L762_NAUPA|nr:V-type ATP synthase subunit F [Nautilia profundicola]ACM92496.1 ATP synthase (F/14-kDa) subunit [Nautilia profundicola AmH]
MKIVLLGNKEECLGFSLCGIETVEVDNFEENLQKVLKNKQTGLVIIADRYYEIFKQKFSNYTKKNALPAIVFIPSFEKTYMQESIKGYLSNVLGIRL